ncbi:hypothetical protein [Olivibacter sitiensis]|uniref:hypothetical protein n=1 Tax=Olivibacter sitiensis TaxID=376470 RepID=UPI0004856E02|nr:hypothetical protein [Olivibacter sitiensis]
MTTITATISNQKDVKILEEILDRFGIDYIIEDSVPVSHQLTPSGQSEHNGPLATLSKQELDIRLRPAFEEIKTRRSNTAD